MKVAEYDTGLLVCLFLIFLEFRLSFCFDFYVWRKNRLMFACFN